VHDGPVLEVRDYVFDHPPNFIDLGVVLLLPVEQFAACSFPEGVIIWFPMYHLSPIRFFGFIVSSAPDSSTYRPQPMHRLAQANQAQLALGGIAS
jgi:hypothetical protein